jgi:hypothetical protein
VSALAGLSNCQKLVRDKVGPNLRVWSLKCMGSKPSLRRETPSPSRKWACSPVLLRALPSPASLMFESGGWKAALRVRSRMDPAMPATSNTVGR